MTALTARLALTCMPFYAGGWGRMADLQEIRAGLQPAQQQSIDQVCLLGPAALIGRPCMLPMGAPLASLMSSRLMSTFLRTHNVVSYTNPGRRLINTALICLHAWLSCLCMLNPCTCWARAHSLPPFHLDRHCCCWRRQEVRL